VSESGGSEGVVAPLRSPRWIADGATTDADVARLLVSATTDAERLEQVAQLAARLLRVPSGHVSLVSDVQTVLGGVGSSADAVGHDVPADDSVCAVTVVTDGPLVVPDASVDVRTRDLDPVRAGVVGSYLGIPLRVRDHLVGALCVYGPEARTWSDADVALLQQLSASAVAELQLAAQTAEHEDERVLWQLAVDAAGVGAFDWNLQTGLLRWDDRLLELFGLDRSTFGGTIEAFTASVHPDDRARVSDALASAIASCGVYDAEYRIVLPDGSLRWVGARGRAIADLEGRAVRVLGAAFDTTAVRDGETRVARVLEAMPTAFYHLDRDWRFTYVNAQAQRLLGAIGERIEGRVLWDLFPETAGSAFETHYRRAVDTGQAVEFEAYYPAPLDRWYEIRGWPTPDGLSVYFLDVTDRRAAESAVADAAQRAVLLASVTHDLTKDLDIGEAAANLARAVVGPWADWSVVTLVDHPDAVRTGHESEARVGRTWRRGLRDVAGWHVDPALRGTVDRYREVRIASLRDDAFLARAVREETAVVIHADATQAIIDVLEPGEAQHLCRQLAPAATVIVPLRGRGRVVGLLSVFRDADRGPFTAEDVADLADAGGRAGLALDNLRLYAQQRDLAESLQRALMTEPPAPAHLQLVVRYAPAAEVAQVGGDWYDAFMQPDGATNIVIGDVVGHDSRAAAAMGQIRGLLRGIAVTTGEGPAEVLAHVDRAMQTLQVQTTATAIVARLEQTPDELQGDGTTRVRWSNAGHPPPLVAVRSDAPATPETTATSSPLDVGEVDVAVLWPSPAELMLGVDPSFDRAESVVTLTQGQTILLYTDGLVERRGQTLGDGIETLRTVLAELVAADVELERLCDELLRRMLPARPEDDVALVAVRLHPVDLPRPAQAGPEQVPEGIDS
jgi:PAS domain S-box-containing protein